MTGPERITIKFMFMAASGRTIEETMKICQIDNIHALLNDVLVSYKKVSMAKESGNHVIALDPETGNPFEIENLFADYSKADSGIASITIPVRHRDSLKSFFNVADVATVFTDAFYVYDRLADIHSKGFEIAIVDNPRDIKNIEYLEPGHISPV